MLLYALPSGSTLTIMPQKSRISFPTVILRKVLGFLSLVGFDKMSLSIFTVFEISVDSKLIKLLMNFLHPDNYFCAF